MPYYLELCIVLEMLSSVNSVSYDKMDTIITLLMSRSTWKLPLFYNKILMQ